VNLWLFYDIFWSLIDVAVTPMVFIGQQRCGQQEEHSDRCWRWRHGRWRHGRLVQSAARIRARTCPQVSRQQPGVDGLVRRAGTTSESARRQRGQMVFGYTECISTSVPLSGAKFSRILGSVYTTRVAWKLQHHSGDGGEGGVRHVYSQKTLITLVFVYSFS